MLFKTDEHLTLVECLESLETKLTQCFQCTNEILKQQFQNTVSKELSNIIKHIIENKCNFIMFTNPNQPDNTTNETVPNNNHNQSDTNSQSPNNAN